MHTSSVFDHFRIASKGDPTILRVHLQLLGPLTKVFDELAEHSGLHCPSISGCSLVEYCVHHFCWFVGHPVGFDDS